MEFWLLCKCRYLKENNIKTSSGLPTTDFIYLIVSSIIGLLVVDLFYICKSTTHFISFTGHSGFLHQ